MMVNFERFVGSDCRAIALLLYRL